MGYIGHRFGIYAYSGKQYFIVDNYGNLVKSHIGVLIHFEHYKSIL